MPMTARGSTIRVPRKAARRPRLSAMLGLSALLVLAPAAGRAQTNALSPANSLAQLLSGASVEGGLVRFLLPCSPLIFDLGVTLARGIVVLTYQSRDYDALTRTFVVRGLEISRGDVSASVDRMRIGATTSVYQGVRLDTRRLPLDPQLRDALKRLGSEIVEGDLALSLDQDAPSASAAIEISANLKRIGRLNIAAAIDGFHVLMPLDGDGVGKPPEGPRLVGHLRSATIAFDDAGLADAAFAIAEATQNLTRPQIQGLAAVAIGPAVAGLFRDLPGEASPALQRRAAGWSSEIQGFLAKPGHLEIALRPARPVDLALFQDGPLTQALVESLEPTVSRARLDAPTLIDPAAPPTEEKNGDMALSRRLVEGLGVPQDIKAGVRLALADALLGDPAAVDIAVRGIVLDPEAAIGLDDATDPYALLILAKARGVDVPERVLKTFADRLPAEMLAAGEEKAQGQWAKTDAGKAAAERLDAAIRERDWSAIRKAAFDHYEGDRAPRNLTEAYALADVAAAGGDRIAAALRDQLRGGDREERALFPLDLGKAKADALWRQVLAARPAPVGNP